MLSVGVFVWNMADTSIDELTQLAASGVTRIYLKCGDGNTYWSQFSYSFAALKKIFKEVYAWQYIYGSGDESLPAQRAANFAPDGFVIDAEGEFESQSAIRPAAYIASIKRYLKCPILLSSFAYAKQHAGIRFSEWDALVDGYLPQLFPLYPGWPNIPDSITLAYNEYTGLTTKPIYPLGELFLSTGPQQTTCNDLTAFIQNAGAGGYEHCALWRAGLLPDSQCFANILKPTPPSPTLEERVANLEAWASSFKALS